MTEHLYSQAAIDKAVKASAKEAKSRPAKRVNEEAGNLEVVRSIPRELYFNAVHGHGVDPKDEGYWKDMEKVVPSIKVNSSSGKIFVGSNHRFRKRYEDISFRKS